VCVEKEKEREKDKESETERAGEKDRKKRNVEGTQKQRYSVARIHEMP